MMVGLPLITTNRQEMVIYEATTAQCAVDETLLCLVWIDTELVAKHVRFHLLTSFAISFGAQSGPCMLPYSDPEVCGKPP